MSKNLSGNQKKNLKCSKKNLNKPKNKPKKDKKCHSNNMPTSSNQKKHYENIMISTIQANLPYQKKPKEPALEAAVPKPIKSPNDNGKL